MFPKTGLARTARPDENKTVKSAAVILCGFVLALAPLFAAQPAWCAAPPAVHRCCHCGGKMACCSAQKNSAPPASATMVRTAPQNELSLPSQIISLPTPLTATAVRVAAIATALKQSALPIFARDCTRLL